MKKGIISRNIGLLMEHFAIANETQLAKLVGLPQSTINKLISGVSADPRVSTLVPIIEHFKLSFDTLFNEDPVFGPPKENQALDLLIPLISYEKIGAMYDSLENLNRKNWSHWYPIPAQEQTNYYALHLNPQQLLKPFDQTSLLIIRNESILLNNSHCLLIHLKSNVVTPKKIIFDNGKQWLLALQSEIPPSEFTNAEWKSLGIIEFSMMDLRRSTFTQSGEKGWIKTS